METPYCRPSLPSLGTFWLPTKCISIWNAVQQGAKHTLVDVAFDHDTHNTCLTSGNLLRQDVCNLRLVLVVLLGVAVTAIDHQACVETLLLKGCSCLLDADLIIVCSFLSTAQNDETIVIANGTDNGDNTRLGDREEVVRVLNGSNSIHSNIKSAVRAILKAHREGQSRGKLTVELRLGCPGANCTNTEQIGQELRRDGIQHLTGKRHALLSQVNKELSRDAQTLVDLEGVIDVWIVDQTLPSDCCTGLLEVGAHDDEEILLVLLLHLDETVAVLESSLGVVDRAGTNDNKKSAVLVTTLDDFDGLIAALENGFS